MISDSLKSSNKSLRNSWINRNLGKEVNSKKKAWDNQCLRVVRTVQIMWNEAEAASQCVGKRGQMERGFN